MSQFPDPFFQIHVVFGLRKTSLPASSVRNSNLKGLSLSQRQQSYSQSKAVFRNWFPGPTQLISLLLQSPRYSGSREAWVGGLQDKTLLKLRCVTFLTTGITSENPRERSLFHSTLPWTTITPLPFFCKGAWTAGSRSTLTSQSYTINHLQSWGWRAKRHAVELATAKESFLAQEWVFTKVSGTTTASNVMMTHGRQEGS